MAEMEPPERAISAIEAGFKTRMQADEKRRFYLYGFLTIISMIATGFAGSYTARAFYASDFYTYLTLGLTDLSTVSLYSKEFLLSLVESLPIVSLTLLFASVLALLSSARASVRHIRAISA